jgi:hypothetical protein
MLRKRRKQMTDRKLMQQALDAMRRYQVKRQDFDTFANEITTLSERLAHCDRCGKKLGGDGDIHTCTPRQPEQEPVAWMTINAYGEEDDIHYENPEGHLLEGWTYRPLYTHPLSVQPQPVKLRRGDILRCSETDELCTVWSTSTTGKTLVKWNANDFGSYTAEQIGELFWLEPKPEQEPVAELLKQSRANFDSNFGKFGQGWADWIYSDLLELLTTPHAAQLACVPVPSDAQVALLDPWMRPAAAKELLTKVLAISLPAPVQEPVAKYIGECSEGSLVQLYEDVKKGTNFYTTPPAAAPVQPEQEPIGEVRNSRAYFYGGIYTDKTDAPDGTKIYTTPPAAQRKPWVGLTDEEIDEAARYCVKSGQSVNAAIGAAEAKLKERNT